MINRNIHNKPAIDPSGSDDDPNGQGYSSDLTKAPDASFPPDPVDNSTAMLGYGPDEEVGESVNPSDAGPEGASLAALGMMVQGAQILSLHIPGFVPMEVTAWLQNSMKVLPQLLQQMTQGLAAAGSGAGMMGPGVLGPQGAGATPTAPPSSPSGPPQRPY